MIFLFIVLLCDTHLRFQYLILFQDHVMSCKFADVKCPNSGCGMYVGRQHLEEHLKSCQHKIISCRWCKESIPAKTKQVQSQSCFVYHIQLLFIYWQQHEQKDCKEYLISCPNSGCDQRFPRRMV